MAKFPQRQPQFEFGFQGRQGVSGNRGPQGFKGIAGEDGLQGNQGYQGLRGAQGNQGTLGANPAMGAQGSQGFQGLQGVQGLQGLFGPDQGNQGWFGVQGIQGLQGPKYGIRGIQGRQGSSGRQGFIGVDSVDIQGIQGSQTGLRGPQGVQGHQGARGWQGLQGYADDGFQGNQGNIGISLGDTGVQGIQSTQGRGAPVGAQGPQGPQGTFTTLRPFTTVDFTDNFTGDIPNNLSNWRWNTTGYGRDPVTTDIFDKPVLELRSGFNPEPSSPFAFNGNFGGIYLSPGPGRPTFTIDQNNLGRFDARLRLKGPLGGSLDSTSDKYSLIFGLVSDVNSVNRASASGDSAFYIIDKSVFRDSLVWTIHKDSSLHAIASNFAVNFPGHQLPGFINYDSFIKDVWYDISIRFELNDDISTDEPGSVRMKFFYKRDGYDQDYVDASVTYEQAIPGLLNAESGTTFDPTFDSLDNVVPFIGVTSYTNKEQVAYVDYFKMTLGRSN